MEAYKEGQLVVVRIQNQGMTPGWFMGTIMRAVSGGYLVRVPSLGEYHRPVYEMPRKRWYARSRKKSESRERDEYEFQSAWSGWVELPRDPMFVLFSRIASRSFCNDIRDRSRGKNIAPETATEHIVPRGNVFPPDSRSLFRAIFA